MIKEKTIYRSPDRSLLHRFLKEEGFNRLNTAADLDLSPPTLDKYLNDPRKFSIEHIKRMSQLTKVDMFFIVDLIY